MAVDNLANRSRPRTFAEVVGQQSEMDILKRVVTKGWLPSAIIITGPYGTGKTTAARLLARSILCDNPMFSAEQDKLPEGERGKPYEPCGVCTSCQAMDNENHPNYNEVDAASHGAVADVRNMKDLMGYQLGGDKPRLQCYDESHMLSAQAQNALLQTIETGQKGVIFLFATTNLKAMLPTIISRCIPLQMKLLSAGEISTRLRTVCNREGIAIEEKAIRIISSYVKGHCRDALMMLDQLHKMADKGMIEEGLVRTYLRLDRYDEIYKLLLETDRKAGLEILQTLLCNYAASELSDTIAEVLVNAYLFSEGAGNFSQIDRAWLQKVLSVRNKKTLLPTAESLLKMQPDFATITYGIATIAQFLFEEAPVATPTRGLAPGSGAQAAVPGHPGRKLGKQ